MPPKGSSCGKSAAQMANAAAMARKQSRWATGTSKPEPTVDSLQELLELSKSRIQELEERVVELEKTSRFHEQHQQSCPKHLPKCRLNLQH